jgi:hypothetical protein
MEQLNLTVLNVEKYLNENTSLNIDKEEIRAILNNNNGGRSIDVVKQLNSIVNIKLNDIYKVVEVDSIKPDEFNSLRNEMNLSTSEKILKPEIFVPKSGFVQLKSTSNSPPRILPKTYEDSRHNMKIKLLENIFESINNLENTLNRFKNI